MNIREKRNEIYQFVANEIKKPSGKEQPILSKLLKEYAKIIKEEQPAVIPKIIIKEKIIYRTKPAEEDNYWA